MTPSPAGTPTRPRSPGRASGTSAGNGLDNDDGAAPQPPRPFLSQLRRDPLGVWVTGRPDEASKALAEVDDRWWEAAWQGRGGWCRHPVGGVEDEVRVVGGWDEDQPAAGAGVADGSGQTRSSLPRLWARQARKYSPAARARPRRLRVVKPRASLSWPKTGSTMALRRAERRRASGCRS